jgi:hypothetical protein
LVLYFYCAQNSQVRNKRNGGEQIRTEETRTKRQLQHIIRRILYSVDCDPGAEARTQFAKAQNTVYHMEVTNNVLVSGKQPH